LGGNQLEEAEAAVKSRTKVRHGKRCLLPDGSGRVLSVKRRLRLKASRVGGGWGGWLGWGTKRCVHFERFLKLGGGLEGGREKKGAQRKRGKGKLMEHVVP